MIVPLNTIRIGRTKPLAQAAMQTSPVITADVIRPVFIMHVIALNCLIVFANLSQTPVSSGKYASISINFFK